MPDVSLYSVYIFVGASCGFIILILDLYIKWKEVGRLSKQKGGIQIKIGLDCYSQNGKLKSFLNIVKTGEDPIYLTRLVWGQYGKIKINTPLTDSPVRLLEEGSVYTQSLNDAYLAECDYIYIIDTLHNVYSAKKEDIQNAHKEYRDFLKNPPMGWSR